MNKKVQQKRKKFRKAEVVNVCATFSLNNTMITVSDIEGHKLFSISPPHLGYKGPQKCTPYAAQAVMMEAIKRMQENHGTVRIEQFKVKGPGAGRDAVLKSVSGRLPVVEFAEATPIVYNGTRSPAPRSV